MVRDYLRRIDSRTDKRRKDFAMLFKKKNVAFATPEIKGKILQAMANDTKNHGKDFMGLFSNCEFLRIPGDRNVWVAQCGDVTVQVWERGKFVENWVVRTQCW